MGFLDFFAPNVSKAKSKYGGLIKLFKLTDFWSGLSSKKREKARIAHSRNLSASNTTKEAKKKQVDSPDVTITHYNAEASVFLNGIATNLFPDKEYDLIEEFALKAIETDPNIVNLHFIYNNLIKVYYKRRNENEKYLDKCIEICKKDINMYPELRKEMKKEGLGQARIPSFQRLAIIYEKQGEYQKAIDICEQAINYGLNDNTKTGFKGRLKRLQKKTKKS
ncbi:MAG: hypothetical protein ACQEQD_10565 [Bacillota bacterium]